MIHYTLCQDASKKYGCVVAATDPRMKVNYFPLYVDSDTLPRSVLPENLRSFSDYLVSGRHNSLGDSFVSNIQAHAEIVPNVLENRLTHPSKVYDGTANDYWTARQKGYAGTFSMCGDCFYAKSLDQAFVPIQGKFGVMTEITAVYQLYSRTTTTVYVYTWVPLGRYYALVETRYLIVLYSGNYQSNSYANVKISVQWPQVDGSGQFTGKISPLKTELTTSGATALLYVILTYARAFTPDPTEYGSNYVHSIVPTTGIPSALDYVYSLRYDPRASREENKLYARNRISRICGILAKNSARSEPKYDEWADLADTAIDSCKYEDINAYAFARDLRTVGSELKAFAQVIANPLNPKAWASLYLGARYGTRLTVSDTQALMKGLKRASKDMKSTWSKDYSTVRSFKNSSPPDFPLATAATRVLHYKVYYKPDDRGLKKLLKTLWDWDLYPSLQNMWDLVPYSFCVDWGGNIEKVLETIDRRQYEELITVLGCTYSYKDEYTIPIKLSDLGFEDATLVVTTYHRFIKPSLHQSSLRLTAGHLSTINVVDGISLILQRVK